MTFLKDFSQGRCHLTQMTLTIMLKTCTVASLEMVMEERIKKDHQLQRISKLSLSAHLKNFTTDAWNQSNIRETRSIQTAGPFNKSKRSSLLKSSLALTIKLFWLFQAKETNSTPTLRASWLSSFLWMSLYQATSQEKASTLFTLIHWLSRMLLSQQL